MERFEEILGAIQADVTLQLSEYLKGVLLDSIPIPYDLIMSIIVLLLQLPCNRSS